MNKRSCNLSHYSLNYKGILVNFFLTLYLSVYAFTLPTVKLQCLQKLGTVHWLGSSTDRIGKENDDKIHKEPGKKNPSVDISL